MELIVYFEYESWFSCDVVHSRAFAHLVSLSLLLNTNSAALSNLCGLHVAIRNVIAISLWLVPAWRTQGLAHASVRIFNSSCVDVFNVISYRCIFNKIWRNKIVFVDWIQDCNVKMAKVNCFSAGYSGTMAFICWKILKHRNIAYFYIERLSYDCNDVSNKDNYKINDLTFTLLKELLFLIVALYTLISYCQSQCIQDW